MTASGSSLRSVRVLVIPVLLLVAFGLAVAIRVLVGGVGVAQSATAGLVFAAVLFILTTACRTRVSVSWSAFGLGMAGASLLSLPVALVRSGPLHAGTGFASWAVVVAVVAVAEEIFLRGALYDSVAAALGENWAVSVGAVAFALLHVPLYGWHVVPLDLAVGAGLGELRRLSGTPFAPAVAHVGADWAAWFLR